MKKQLIGFLAIVIAIGAVAFTAPQKDTTNYFWFPFEDEQIQTIPSSVSATSTDPFTCGGENEICSEAYVEAQTELINGNQDRQVKAAQLGLEHVQHLKD
jgi:hypothetical protein